MKNKILNFLLLFFALFFSFFLSELTLRFLNFKPSGEYTEQGVGGIYTKDLLTGWRNSAGAHKIINEQLSNIMSINEDGSRYCRFSENNFSEKKILFVGDSFTQGGGLSDDEIYPCKFQAMNANYQIINFGTGGYGGCQSLIRMKDWLKENPTSIDGNIVMYGLNPIHQDRNVASSYYVWQLARHSVSRTTFMPYCSLNQQNSIEINPPEIIAETPYIVRHSAVLTAFEGFYYRIKSYFREKNKASVEEKILLEMKSAAEKSNSKFILLLMYFHGSEKEKLIKFLQENNFEFIDGSHPKQESLDMKIADGHPNYIMHNYWAELINTYLVNPT